MFVPTSQLGAGKRLTFFTVYIDERLLKVYMKINYIDVQIFSYIPAFPFKFIVAQDSGFPHFIFFGR
jgi:hypothetical protein